MMPIQTHSARRSAASLHPSEGPALRASDTSSNAAFPSWEGRSKAQESLQPKIHNALSQGLRKPSSAVDRDPGDNSHLSVDQIIKLVKLAEALEVKVQILRAYVSNRASDLSAQEVKRMAQHTKTPGKWSDEEKVHHDQLFVLYLESRDDKLDPQDAILIAKASFKSGEFQHSIQKYVEENAQSSELGSEQVVALVGQVPTLSVKVNTLRAYVEVRGVELSAEEASALAGEAKEPGHWVDKEKRHHDELLAQWVQLRREAGALAFDDVLSIVAEVFSEAVSDQILIDYAQKQKPSLDERIQLAALAKESATVEAILHGIETHYPDLDHEQVIQIAKTLRSLAAKVRVLQGYVEIRSADLTAKAAIALAQEAKTPGKWSDKEKDHHDALLKQWVQLRLAADSLSFGDLLEVATKAFDSAVSDQMLLDYVLTQKPSLDQRMHLAALVEDSAIAALILVQAQG